ncbi:dTMP kinase [Treponema sp.]|uniref:dTMP kinase n=1 Tax=Treponema sp. TaxID=166 RepID=UPI0025E53796|nr:dTMP kinase [Treponema sp.]MCR5219113.1 dTMP kinase [Treponema sp.]
MLLKNFIVFEGIDGAGTTTQLNLLKEMPESRDFLYTAEPSKAPTGLFLRQMLKGDFKITNETSAYLFAADRNQHVNGDLITEGSTLISGIKNACLSGKIVISDRYFFSSLAYQSIDCPKELPVRLNSGFPLPQLLFYFDIEAKDALKRVDSRGEREIYEKEDFLTKTVNEYRRVIDEYALSGKKEGMKTVIIDACLSKEEIAALIQKEIKAIL